MPAATKQQSGILLGATGLVGHQLFKALRSGPDVDPLVTLTRRQVPEPASKNWIQLLAHDFSDLSGLAIPEGLQFAVSCLGSTLKQAGSKLQIRNIDFGYNLAFAKKARQAGVERFVLLSSMGASANSFIFYNQVKGELEDAVRALDFPSLVIVRPALLLGERTEVRVAERAAIRGFELVERWTGAKALRPFATPVSDLVSVLRFHCLTASPDAFRIVRASEI